VLFFCCTWKKKLQSSARNPFPFCEESLFIPNCRFRSITPTPTSPRFSTPSFSSLASSSSAWKLTWPKSRFSSSLYYPPHPTKSITQSVRQGGEGGVLIDAAASSLSPSPSPPPSRIGKTREHVPSSFRAYLHESRQEEDHHHYTKPHPFASNQQSSVAGDIKSSGLIQGYIVSIRKFSNHITTTRHYTHWPPNNTIHTRSTYE